MNLRTVLGDRPSIAQIWERDEDAFEYDDEDALEPPVPAGLGLLTASQRALADFLRLDADLLTIAAQVSRPLAEAKTIPASWPDGSRICRRMTKTSSCTGLPEAMGPGFRWSCGVDSTANPTPSATAIPGVPWPNCWMPPLKPAASARYS